MRKILTIIIPSYNMEKYLSNAINSLIIKKELFEKIEILVVNDGSTDNTLNIANKFQNNYPNTIFVINKKNGNYGSCINEGLRQAKGYFIKILDADDTFIKNTFEQYVKSLCELLESNNVPDMIITDSQIIDENGKITKHLTHKEISNRIIDISKERLGLFSKLTHHSITYKLEVLKEMNYIQKEKLSYTDQEWVSLPFLNLKKYYYMPLTLYSYLVGRVGQTMEPKTLIKQANNRLEVKKHMIEFYSNEKDKYDKENTEIVFNLIINLIEPLYFEYILKYNGLLSIKEITNFDQYLSSRYKEFYLELEKCRMKFFNILYIKKFREDSCSVVFKLIQKIYFINNRGFR